MKVARRGIVISLSPSVLALGLFYSLAIHMYRTLGGWPTGIGEVGFSPALFTHATIATTYFWSLVPLSMAVVPVGVVLCLVVPQWRRQVPYLVMYGLAFALCVGLMQLAPEAYLDWWRD